MLAPVLMLSATRQNLWRLTFIRTLVLAAQAGSVAVAYWTELLPLPWLALSITLGFSMVLCVLTAIRLRTSLPVTELEYAVQLACDLLIHSALLYFSGGSTNPFVSYYLVPLAIAAVTLPWLYSLILSGIALVAYTLLLVQYFPLETFPMAREKMQIYGMWLSFALAAGVITFFATKMAEELRRQQQFQAQPAHLVHGRMDRGQADGQSPRKRRVVVAHDGDVAAGFQALVAGSAHDAHGQEVVDGEDGGGAIGGRQQPGADIAAGVRVERAFNAPVRRHLHAVLRAVGEETFGAVAAGAGEGFAHHHGDAAVAHVQQVLGGQPAAFQVVAGDRAMVIGMAADQHEGHVAPRQLGQERIGRRVRGRAVRVTQDQAVHAARQRHVDQFALLVRFVLRVGHESQVAVFSRGLGAAFVNGGQHPDAFHRVRRRGAARIVCGSVQDARHGGNVQTELPRQALQRDRARSIHGAGGYTRK